MHKGCVMKVVLVGRGSRHSWSGFTPEMQLEKMLEGGRRLKARGIPGLCSTGREVRDRSAGSLSALQCFCSNLTAVRILRLMGCDAKLGFRTVKAVILPDGKGSPCLILVMGW